MPWKCFLLTPAGVRRAYFRRSVVGKCKGRGVYHEANGRTWEEPGSDEWNRPATAEERAQPGWPTKCLHCEYVFTPGDALDVYTEEIYVRKDTGARMTWREAPAGAMRVAEYLRGWHDVKAPDGYPLIVKLPGGADWCVDRAARSGGHWSRCGIPPRITVTPSINADAYHSYLRNGVLEDDLHGRSYPLRTE